MFVSYLMHKEKNLEVDKNFGVLLETMKDYCSGITLKKWPRFESLESYC